MYASGLDRRFAAAATDRSLLARCGLAPAEAEFDAKAYEELLENEARPALARLERLAREEGDAFLQPKVVYGWFPCASEGDDLVVYDPADPAAELERFTFPRQRSGRRLSIADFFRPGAGGGRDVVGFTCVTMGPKIGRAHV